MEQAHYEIQIKGHLSVDWSDWFYGLTVTNLDGGEATISGHIADQAALYGVLTRLYSLNLTLLGVRRIAPDRGEPAHRHPTCFQQSLVTDRADRW
jgi:hypothetical protein